MVVVTGARGQLGSAVVSELKKRGIEHIGIGREEVDITDGEGVRRFFSEIKPSPSCVIHCAAYINVEDAEDESELCMSVNVGGSENIAKVCREIDAEMFYISTDYVFDGSGDSPYETDSVRNPLSIYGKSKADGEDAVMRCLEKYYIVRVTWVFGENGNNFIKAMLKLAQTKSVIDVVSDQFATPTYAVDLAGLLCDMALSGRYGTYHATNEGFCSRAEFAEEIMRVSGSSCRINPILMEQFPAKAARPKNSRLSKTSLSQAHFDRLPDWKDALRRYLSAMS